MLKLAYNHGTRVVVCTPHMFLDMFLRNDATLVRERFSKFHVNLRELASGSEHQFLREMRVTLGSENYASLEFLEALDRRQVVPINDGRYLLVEFSPFLPIGKLEIVLQKVLQSGYFPIIAHTERVIAVQEKPARLENLADAGCLFQVNGDSFLDSGSSRLRKTAHKLASAGLLHIVASDGHRIERRPPILHEAFQKLRDRYPQDVENWMWGNPNVVIGDGGTEN